MDRRPNLDVKQIQLKELMEIAKSAFHKRKNRTMERHKFLARKQAENESLEQFWNALNGMAANCELQGLTETLVYDVFILNMRNAMVQERLLTEPKDSPEEALRFAIAYEQGVQQKRHIGKVVCIKDEPIFAVEGTRDCQRCGAKSFTMAHLKICKARNEKCNKCQKVGHFAKFCRTKRFDTRPKRVQVVKKQHGWDSTSTEEDDEAETQVLHLTEENQQTQKPFILKGKLNGKPFSVMIDDWISCHNLYKTTR